MDYLVNTVYGPQLAPEGAWFPISDVAGCVLLATVPVTMLIDGHTGLERPYVYVADVAVLEGDHHGL